MSPRPRFENLEEEKKEKILEAAADEFGKHGFDAASINRIIKRAGISKGAAYYYFDDKGDLYSTALQYAMKAYERFAMGPDFTVRDFRAETFWEDMHEMGVRGVWFMHERPWIVRLFRGFFAYEATHRSTPAIELMWQSARKQTQDWLEHGQEIGRIRDDIPMELFIDIMFGVGMTLDRWLFEHLDELDEEGVEDAVAMIIDMVRRVSEPRGEEKR